MRSFTSVSGPYFSEKMCKKLVYVSEGRNIEKLY